MGWDGVGREGAWTERDTRIMAPAGTQELTSLEIRKNVIMMVIVLKYGAREEHQE